MSVYRMEIPGWSPVLLNQLIGRHPGTIARLKRRDADQLAIAKLVHGVPDAAGPRRVHLTIAGRYGRLPDDDAPLKSCLDGLTRARLIVDDSARWCDWEKPVFVRGPKATVIELEDMEV